MNKLLFTLFLSISAVSYSQNIPLSNIQVIGSHNSYKKAINEKVYDHILNKNEQAASLQYEHIPIEDQLNIGLRNLEIDIWKDEKGGKYANPNSVEISKIPYQWKEEMMKPGFKVFHMPDYDCETHEPHFVKVLEMLKNWSQNNPNHETTFITLELKDDKKDSDSKFNLSDINSINNLLNDYLGTEKLITPKELKRTNEKVIWPSIDDSRGKFVWIVDNTDYRLDLFNEIDLNEANVFLNVEAEHPKSGCMIINEPTDKRISDFANRGYIIRTRADAGTVEARNNDYSRFEQAKISGAQIITTDYYIPSKMFKSDYKVIFQNGSYVRVK